jgi:hypothetical protein
MERDKYFYNVATGEVEHGRQSHSDVLMGPYDTAEEASRALQIAAEKTEQWEEEERRWQEDA